MRFAVCTSSKNTAVLAGGEVLGAFCSLLGHPESVQLLNLEGPIKRIKALVLYQAPLDARTPTSDDLPGWEPGEGR